MGILWGLGSVLTLAAGVALWLQATGPTRTLSEVRVENRTGQDVRSDP